MGHALNDIYESCINWALTVTEEYVGAEADGLEGWIQREYNYTADT
jgi:hypothetical protein